MPSLTVRNISENMMEKLRAVSKAERRSLNNEILVILEKGLEELASDSNIRDSVPRSTQLSIWQELCGTWEDSRSTKEIIGDITDHRTFGRDINL